MIAGGQDQFGKVFADVWVLSLALGSWSSVPAVADEDILEKVVHPAKAKAREQVRPTFTSVRMHSGRMI